MNKNFRKKILLNSNWEFALYKTSNRIKLDQNIIKPGKYFPAEVPGTIHTDLMRNNIIDDPFYADNELKLDWIANNDWVYETEFEYSEKKDVMNDLVFEGLDTNAEIYLNDIKIDSTNNMFVSFRFNVSKILINGKNKLRVIFYSPMRYAKQLEHKYGQLQVALNSSRVYIRKAQYSFGWDWGPTFATSGIWKDVYLEERDKIFIKDLTFSTESIRKNNASVSIKTFLNVAPKSKYTLLIEISNSDKCFVKKFENVKDQNQEITMVIAEPQLWWPNGEGEQNLYELNLKLLDKEENIIDEVKKSVGIRTINLIQKEKNKSVFKLKVNNRIIFCKGANWIPADSFLPRVSESKYTNLLSAAKNANMNIIRVWGGGAYESNKFYNICDELGLLVWQDFMFACAAYPEYDEFIENVKNEVNQNVLRLQHHPSIAIWCGNNENEWIWFQEQKISYKKMPGYKIYHSVIPNILRTIDPERPYWPSSPFSYEEDPNSFNSGNTHQWNIWSRWIDYEEVKHDESLFVTEFGFQGPANISTFEKCLPSENRRVHDQIFEFHNKQVEGPERIIKFLSGHLPISTNWDDFIYLTQLNQGFALKRCLEHWRTNGRTFGSLIWQLNDCWPVTSWSLIDSELLPKLSYHFVKNIFNPHLIYFTNIGESVELNIQNQSWEKFKGHYKLLFIDATSGQIIKQTSQNINVDQTVKIIIDSFPISKFQKQSTIVFAKLYDDSGSLVNYNYYKELPWKYYNIASSELAMKIIIEKDKKILSVKTNKPNYFVDLHANGIEFTKRGFTIFPDEEIFIEMKSNAGINIKVSDIKVYSLNNYLS